MSKNIAFFADGTWNGTDPKDENKDGIADLTNVIKMFCSLEGGQTLDTTRLQDEQELIARDAAGAVTQHAKYIHGVGDSNNPLMRLLGGVFGAGIIQRIVRGYTFISRNYQAGDRIFITGFSRGAYTARALGGMIAGVGLEAIHFPRNAKAATLSPEVIDGLMFMMGPLYYMIVFSGLGLALLYNIDRKRHEEILRALEDRRAGSPSPQAN